MNNSKIKVIEIALDRLKPSPLLKETGMMSKLIKREKDLAKNGGKEKAKHLEKVEILEGRLKALGRSIQVEGIRKPLEVCPSGDDEFTFDILDGRHRAEVAKGLGLKTVPCVVRHASEARDVVFAATLNKPMSKGSLAYLALSLNPETALSLNGGDRKSVSSCETDLTAQQLAEKVGVSIGLMSQAVTLYRMLHNFKIMDSTGAPLYVPRAKAKFENAIFTPGNGLGGIISGVIQFRDGAGAGAEKPRTLTKDERQAEMVDVFRLRVTAATRDLGKKWEKAPAAMKARLVEAAADELLQNEDFAIALADSLRATLAQ